MGKSNSLIRMLLYACSVMSLAAGEFKLAENGRPHCRIQGSQEPAAPEYRAVSELQRYLKKVTGADVIRNTSPGNIWRVFRGENPDIVEIMPVLLEDGRHLLPEKVIRRLEQAKSREAFYICSQDAPRRGKSIFIAGRTPMAVLYGTNAFIEDYLGVRFFHAGPEGEYCPRRPTVILKDVDDFREPWLPNRRMSCWAGSVKPWSMQDMEEWLTRRAFHWDINHNYNNLSLERLNHSATGNFCQSGGGHSTFELSIPQNLFKTHPEFFPLQDGRRVCKARSQRCFSNPEVRRRIIEYVCWHTDYNQPFCINFHDSTDGWCSCPDCIRYGTDKAGKYSLSNVAFRLVSEVSSAVLKHNPQARLSCLIYSDYREMPTNGVRLSPEILGIFCTHQRCAVHPLNDVHSDCNRYFFKLFGKWRKVCPKIGLFDYYAYSNAPYCPMEYTLGKDMKYYREIGLDTWIEDCTNKKLPIPASNWQFYYAASKLTWNADLDVEKLMDEAYGLYYGPASVPMKSYHALRRELWEAAPGHAVCGGSKRYGFCLLIPGAEKRLLGFLDQAEKLARGDAAALKRIAMDRKFLTEFWIAEAARIRKTQGVSKGIPVAVKTSPVKIDGVLDEDAWRRARLVTPFLTMKGRQEPAEETRVRILYDEQNWYFGIEAMTEHAWSSLVTKCRERDGRVWEDDSVEIFMAPPAAEYYQFVINSIGTLYDARGRNHLFDSGAELRTRVLKDRYVAEIRIPVKQLGREKIRSGEGWQFHFCRACKNLQPPRTSDYSTIQGIEPHAQERFLRGITGISILRNGDFFRTEKVPENQRKKISSNLFPADWGASSAGMIADGGKNMVELRDVIWTALMLQKDTGKTRVTGELIASGKGTVTVSLSGCIRPRVGRKPFGHEIKRTVAKISLTEEVTVFPIEFETEPDSEYFIYFRVRGGAGAKALIRSISLNR